MGANSYLDAIPAVALGTTLEKHDKTILKQWGLNCHSVMEILNAALLNSL